MNDDQKAQQRTALSDEVVVEPFHPISAAASLEVGAASEGGPGRAHNTDHYLAIRLGRLQETLMTSLPAADLPGRFEEYGYAMLVADGLGQVSGMRASRVALSTLAHLAIRYGKWNIRIDSETPDQIVEQGRFFYRQTNDAIFRASQAAIGLNGMATSLTALYFAQEDLFFAHVGHSGAFLLRSGSLIQLTPDHSLEPVGGNGPSSTLGRVSRTLGHVVVRTLGARPAAPDIEIERIKLSSGDRLLLCTNGLTDVVSQEQIADALAARRRPQEDCLHLIGLARAAGSSDDVTVMLGDYTLRGCPAR